MIKKLNFLIYLIIVIIILSLVVIVNIFHQERIETLMQNKYSHTASTIKEQIDQLIEDQKQQGLTLALSLSQNNYIIDFLENPNKPINLNPLIDDLAKYSKQQNIWIHLVSNEGISRYRSWAKKSGDNVAIIREELPPLLKNPQPTSLVSVGIFDLSFKNIVPVYKENKFVGLVEVIAKTNSIAKNLENKGFNPVILVDKKYFSQIKKPFTKKFVNEYYVANLNANKQYMNIIQSNIEKFIYINDYAIVSDHLITRYSIKDIFNEDMAYIIIFDDLKNIDTKDIENIDIFIKILGFTLFALFAIIIISAYFYNKSKYAQKLEKTVEERTKEIVQLKDYQRVLFDKNPNIVFIRDKNHGLLDANYSFFKLFPNYSTIEELNQHDECLCNYTINIDDSTYINPNEEWDLQVTQTNRKLCINKDGVISHFKLESEKLPHHKYNDVFLITLADITELINTQKNLETNKEILFHQSKMAAMGDMIGNIAHQWRQPLSVISTLVSGIKLKLELNGLEYDDLFKDIDVTMHTTQHLSTTIDDFKDFIKQKDVAENIIVQEKILDVLNILDASLNNNFIELITELNMQTPIESYLSSGQLSQVLMNLINNSKDALKEKNQNPKWIKVRCYKEDSYCIITVEDNGGGIAEDVIDHIYEPYFTTKHQSQGTGLGLNMSYKIVTETLNGEISANNTPEGVIFIIKLPL